MKLIDYFSNFFLYITNVIFLIFSKQSKNPLICGVIDLNIPDLNISGRVFYPSLQKDFYSTGVPWFSEDLSRIIRGKLNLILNPESRSFFISAVFYLSKLIPSVLLPTLPNTLLNSPCLQKQPLPVILWSHGRAGNVHDHALMLSQLAVEVPAICLCVTHTDGSADVWRDSNKKSRYFRNSSGSESIDERLLKESLKMAEYLIHYRCSELIHALTHLKEKENTRFNISNKVILGGYDLGGSTSLALASKLKAAGTISLDGVFSINDKFKFPRSLFDDSIITTPTAFLLSDEWELWNRAMTDNTKLLIAKTNSHKLITVKQTKHNNFTECMFWVPRPLVFVLRLAGYIHRRGSPRKTYRRTVKWLVATIQQYLDTEPSETSIPEFSQNSY